MSSSFVKDCTDASGSGGTSGSSKTLIIIVNNEGGNNPLGGQEIQNLLASHGADASQVSVLQMGPGAQAVSAVDASYIPAGSIPENALAGAPINFMVDGFPGIPIEDASAGYDEIPLDADTLQSIEKALKSEEAKEIFGDPLLDMVADSGHFESMGSISGDDDPSSSGGQRRHQRDPTRRSQRQMDKVEREEVEKIRAENRQMLQQEKEELLKAQVEREALETIHVQEKEEPIQGKGKGKSPLPSISPGKGRGVGTPILHRGRGKGRGEKVMPIARDESDDEPLVGKASNNERDEDKARSSSDSEKESTGRPSKAKGKSRRSKPENTFQNVKILKDIKMRSLTVTVEKLNVKDISATKQEETSIQDSSVPSIEASNDETNLTNLDGEDSSKKELSKKKTLKEFEPALFSSPDVMLKVKGDRSLEQSSKVETRPKNFDLTKNKKKSSDSLEDFLSTPNKVQNDVNDYSTEMENRNRKVVQTDFNLAGEVPIPNLDYVVSSQNSDSLKDGVKEHDIDMRRPVIIDDQPTHRNESLLQDKHAKVVQSKRRIIQVLNPTEILQVVDLNGAIMMQREDSSNLVPSESAPTEKIKVEATKISPPANPSKNIPPANPSKNIPPANPSKNIGSQQPKTASNLIKKVGEGPTVPNETEKPAKGSFTPRKDSKNPKMPSNPPTKGSIANPNQMLNKTKPSLNRNNIICKLSDNIPEPKPRASILMQSPSISKSLMNYKIPLKNPSKNRPPLEPKNPTGSIPALQSTNLSRSGENPHNSSPAMPLKNNPTPKNTTKFKEVNQKNKSNPISIPKPPTINHKQDQVPNSPIIKSPKTPKQSKFPLTPWDKAEKVTCPIKKNPSAATDAEIIEIDSSPNASSDIRRSKRPAKKKNFGDDILFLDEKMLGDDKENDTDDDFEVTSVHGLTLEDSPSEDDDDDDYGPDEYDDPDRLWCICQKPHHNRFMICCDRCEDWFHGSCVGVNKAMGKQWEEEECEWICPNCKKAERAIKGIVSPVKKGFQGPSATMEVQVLNNQPSVANKYGSAPVLVYEKRTGVLLSGSDAPTLGILPEWLKKHPNYAPISMSMMESIRTDPKTGIKKILLPSSSSEEPPNSDHEELQEFKTKKFYRSSKNIENKNHKHSVKIMKGEDEGNFILKEKKKKDDLGLNKSMKKPPLSPQSIKESIRNLKKQLSEASRSLSSMGMPKDRKISSEKREESASTPSHKLKEKKHKSIKSPEVESFTPQKRNFPTIRSSVKKMLYEALDKRKSEVPHEFKSINSEAIQDLCEGIEEQLFLAFNKDLGFKYKARYRSLVFNIRDNKNGGLFRQILTGTIPPAKLATMTSEELASKELAEWRVMEEKKELEAIQKHELDMLALGNRYIMKSHKGEIMIDKDDFIKSKETAPDTLNSLPADELFEAPPPEEHEEDIINSHRNHIYDPNCKICIKSELQTYKLSDKDATSGDKENLDISKKRELAESETSRQTHKKHKKDRDKHKPSDTEKHRSHKSKHKDKEKQSSDESERHRSRHKSDDSRPHEKERKHSDERRRSESDRHKKHHRRRESESGNKHKKESRRDPKDEKKQHRRHSSESSHRKRKHSERQDPKRDSSKDTDQHRKKRKSDKITLVNEERSSSIDKYSDSNDLFEDSTIVPCKQEDGYNSDSKPEVSTSEDIVFLPTYSSKMYRSSPDVEPTSTGSPFPLKEDVELLSPSTPEGGGRISHTSSPRHHQDSPATPPLPNSAFHDGAPQGKVLGLISYSPSQKSPTMTPPLPAEADEALLSPATPPLPDEEERLTPPLSQTSGTAHKSLLQPIWKGSINMPDVATFTSAAFEVSGKARYFSGDVPYCVEVVGRISPEVVWEYIAQMKKSGSKEILVTRFQPSSDIERASYIALYSYLSSKKRYGVVGQCGKFVKDFYLVPLAAHQPIPQVLLPLDGPGFEESRPHMLIGVIIRTKYKRAYDTVSGVWIEDGSGQSGQKRASIDEESSTAIASSLNIPSDEENERSYTPPPASHPLNKLKPESLDPKPTRSISTSEEEPEVARNKQPAGITKARHSSDRDSMLAELNRQIERDRKELSEMQKTVDDKIEESESHTPPGSPTQKETVGTTLDTSKISIPSNLHEILNNIKKKEEAIQEKELEIKRRLNLNFHSEEDVDFREEIKDDDSFAKDVDLRLLMPQPIETVGSGKDEDMRLLTNPMGAGVGPPPHPLGDTDFRMRDPRIPKQDGGGTPEVEEDPKVILNKMSDVDLLEKVKEMETHSALPPHYPKHRIEGQDPRSHHPANIPPAAPPKSHSILQPPPGGGDSFAGPMPPFESFEPLPPCSQRGPPHGPPIGPNPPPFIPPRHGGPPVLGRPDFDPNYGPPPPRPEEGQFHQHAIYHPNSPHAGNPADPDFRFPRRPKGESWDANRPPGAHWNDSGRFPDHWDGRGQHPLEGQDRPPHPSWPNEMDHYQDYAYEDRRNPNMGWKKRGNRGGSHKGAPDNQYWQKGGKHKDRKWHRSSNEGVDEIDY